MPLVQTWYWWRSQFARLRPAIFKRNLRVLAKALRNYRIGERAFFRSLLLFVLSSFGKRSLRYQMHTGRSYV